jgi:superfamily I DNA/RNA helicase
MAHRIAHLIAERHLPASNILGLSFTKKAAEELKERVKALVAKVSGPQATRGITITTFHSLCVKILRQNADRIGFSRNFSIMDANDQTDLVRQTLRHIKVDDRKFDPQRILFEIGQAKNRFLTPEQSIPFFLDEKRLPADYGEIVAQVYPRYLDQLRMLDAMDFDDLLFRCVELLGAHEDVRRGANLKFRHILVDEYQDTNPSQFELLSLLTQEQQNLCVVGDDDQSIYGWRGADSQHILQFTHHYPSAKVITLDQNYRSTSTILEAANEVIANNKVRHAKKLWSDKGSGTPIQQLIAEEDRAEAEMVSREILALAQEDIAGHTKQKRPWKDFAVLYRSNPQSRLFEEALRMHHIPYKLVGALSFLDRKEIKDTLSYLRLIVNPKDDASLRRVINWPARGIGKTALENLGAHAVQAGIPLFLALPEAVRLGPAKSAGAVLAFRDMIASLRQSLEATPLEPAAISNWAKAALERIGVKKALEEEWEDPIEAQKRWENIDELLNGMGQLKPEELLEDQELQSGTTTALAFVREYLSRLALEASDEAEDKEKRDAEKDQVTLLTLHGSKGLEYPVVFLVGFEDGLIPHRRTIEEAHDYSEERRLCYVGITRAKEHLYITRTKNRIRYGKAVPRTPSRFLAEIPGHLYITRDESYSPDPNSKEEVKRHEERVVSFLDQIRANLGASKKPGIRP